MCQIHNKASRWPWTGFSFFFHASSHFIICKAFLYYAWDRSEQPLALTKAPIGCDAVSVLQETEQRWNCLCNYLYIGAEAVVANSVVSEKD